MDNNNSQPIGKRVVLEEQRRAFDKVTDSVNSLDQKLQALLSSASLIVSLAGTVQITVLRQSGGYLFLWGLLGTTLLYVLMVGVILWGLRPVAYFDPIDNDWNNLAARYFDAGEEKVLENLIADYLYFTEINRSLSLSKVWMLRVGTGLFMLIIIAILSSVALSLSP